MKKATKILAISLLALLYCIAAATVSSGPVAAAPMEAGQKEGNSVSIASAKLFCPVEGSENSLKTSGSTPSSPSIKNPLKRFFTLLRFTGRVITVRFSQYVFFSRNLPILSRKSDVLFPFHYFW